MKLYSSWQFKNRNWKMISFSYLLEKRNCERLIKPQLPHSQNTMFAQLSPLIALYHVLNHCSFDVFKFSVNNAPAYLVLQKRREPGQYI